MTVEYVLLCSDLRSECDMRALSDAVAKICKASQRSESKTLPQQLWLALIQAEKVCLGAFDASDAPTDT
jgi:hypothetical protein